MWSRRSLLFVLGGTGVALYGYKPAFYKSMGFVLNNIIKREVKKQKYDGVLVGDTHSHTTNSDGRKSVDSCMNLAIGRGLDFLLITDHLDPLFPKEHFLRTVKESNEFLIRNEEKIMSCPAVEITTKQGHLIAYFPEDYLKKPGDLVYLNYLRSLEKTIMLVHSIGGRCIVAHPALGNSSRNVYGAKENTIRTFAYEIDNIEQDNGMYPLIDRKKSNSFKISGVSASDSHLGIDVGSCFGKFPNKGSLFDSLNAGMIKGYSPVFDKFGRMPIEEAIRFYSRNEWVV